MPDDPWEQAAKNFRGAGKSGPDFTAGLPARTAPSEDWKIWQQSGDSDSDSGGFTGQLWNEIKSGPANLLGVGNAITNTVLHPIKTLESMGQQNIDMAKQTRDAFKGGNIQLGIRKAVNTGINAVAPGMGRSVEDAAQLYDKGDIPGWLGKSTGIAVNTGLGIKAPRIMEGAANLPTAIRNLRKVDPRVATNRALRPVPSDPNFPDHTPESLAAIKDANAGTNPATITNGKLDMIAATNKAIETHQAALEKWLARARGVRVSGDELVSATRDAIPELMWTRDPAGARALIQQAQDAFGGKMFTTDQFRTFLKSENADLSAFYKRAPGVQADAAVAGTPPGIEAAQTQRIRDVLYKALDPEGNGAGPRTIQARTGDLYAKRDAALRRNNAIVAEQPLDAIGRVFDPIKGWIRAVLPGKATGAGIAFAEGSEGRSLPLLKRAFNAVGDPDKLPLPGEPLYPTGNPQRQITAGDVITPPPADTSGVRSAPAMRQPPNPRRAITQGDIQLGPEAPPEPITKPGHYPVGPNPRRALPPASTIISPKYGPPDAPAPRGTTPATELPPAMDGSYVRTVDSVPKVIAELRKHGADLSGPQKNSEFVVRNVGKQLGLPNLTPQEITRIYSEYSGEMPKFAKGGIAGRHGPEKIIVGDGGEPEAIIPLSKLPPRLSTPGSKQERHLINSLKYRAMESLRPPKLETPRHV